jgi:hypothetical protein
MYFAEQYVVVLRGFGVTHQAGHVVTQIYHRVRFDAAFLFAFFGQAAATLEDGH